MEYDYQIKDFTYYSRIVMMIVNSVQLILFIVFVVFAHSNYDNMAQVQSYLGFYEEDSFTFIFKEQKDGINTCFSFFIIAFVVFLVEFIMHFAFEDCRYKYDCSKYVFRYWNHLIIILTFVIMQFLYIVCCLIIPIYLHRVRTLRNDLKEEFEDPKKDKKYSDMVDSCVAKYAGSLVFSFVFLFIFIFLYFIIINLYKGICCDMIEICRSTQNCLKRFFNCFWGNCNFIFHKCEGQPGEIGEKKKTIAKITSQIQNEMKKNIDLRIKNIDYL